LEPGLRLMGQLVGGQARLVHRSLQGQKGPHPAEGVKG
jgi:hypothetical protein